jgi:hypothetical protein
MPKRIFWPVALLVMGLVFLASKLELLPSEFANLWPILLIVIGLGGLLTSDRDEWLGNSSTQSGATRSTARPAIRRSVAKKAPARNSTRTKSRKK